MEIEQYIKESMANNQQDGYYHNYMPTGVDSLAGSGISMRTSQESAKGGIVVPARHQPRRNGYRRLFEDKYSGRGRR